ncbi:toxic anion resistance protein [Vibrio sp. Of7-15]|uniref:toxic anion resistance protein n=1 Tax=Vibrio sp. Of7-15 TaxID=2724879 RepID=UPI001EF2A41B|nr:toxic anion resistance protein [Vibrio sp. Of7-15]MCG7498075.1 toxic anion resistance protein [Vibrio sp. Of7-15]
MVKTFHSSNNKNIKLFSDVKKKPKNEDSHKKAPSVLFFNKAHKVNSNIDIPDDWKQRVDDLLSTQEFNNLSFTDNDYLKSRVYFDEIDIENINYQIEFGNDLSQRFQNVQGDLSDYAKLGKVDKLTWLGNKVIDIAKSINISIFNPNKLSTKLSRLLNNRKTKVDRIKVEFDFACDQIDKDIDTVFNDLDKMKSTMHEFDALMNEIESIYNDLNIRLLSLKLKISHYTSENLSGDNLDSDNLDPFYIDKISNNKESILRWERKISNLMILRQSVLLTLPQLKLYSSNLISGFTRLEYIRANIIQIWKQQFLTAIAIDEKSEVSLFHELNDVQESLFNSIAELNENGI